MAKRKIQNNFHVLAVDVETSGSSYKDNGILSIGASLCDQDSAEKESFQANMILPEGREYEKDCKANFWDKHPEAKKFVETNAKDPRDAMEEFSKFLTKIEQCGYSNITIVSDNPSFDVGWIDYYLALYSDRKPLRYSDTNSYRMVWDSVSIQKTWLSLKTPDALFHSPPTGHREKLELQSPYTHDHNPLNDARTIAHYYLQTLEQMEQFRGTLPKPMPSKVIKLADYNPEWKDFFIYEKESIINSFNKTDSRNLLEVHHVGSTSVEGLIAKPIIDIILVVKNSDLIDAPLSNVGYKYKGEYNIPMRKMYGKNTGYEVYLHAYEEGNPEIKLNLMFRGFLMENADAREKYSNLKKLIVEKCSVHSKVLSTGITTYNLEKNDFIQEILNKAGFKELCIRLCTQKHEWDVYNSIRKDYELKLGKTHEINLNDSNQKHIVLHEGTKVIGGVQLQVSSPNAFIAFLALSKEIDSGKSLSCKSYFIENIEKWAKKLKVLFLTTFVDSDETSFYQENDYNVVAKKQNVMHMLKYLGESDNQVEVQTNLSGEIPSAEFH